MKVITDDVRVPIKVWAGVVEDGAILQARNLARLPFAFHHVALMPDVHQGYGMPIGGVLATEGVVIPNAVGVDIGCGMAACRSSLESIDIDMLKAVMGRIRKEVPVGFAHHQYPQPSAWIPGGPIGERELEASSRQVGTLGGGNHFIEIQQGSDGRVWVMVHSGSRNVGKQVADHYNKLARSINARWRSSVPDQWELAFFPFDTDEGQAYLSEMSACLDFARENRAAMMTAIRTQFPTGTTFDRSLDVHHNYAAIEHHFGRNVYIHRKGATSAREGQGGIIPGSQGTKSYIVSGKGSADSFQSCSHGAGRRMGRKEAQRTLSLEDEQRRLDERGILHAIRGRDDLDEAAGAYKDIDTVMAEQADLVSVEVELSPLGVIKG